MGSTLRQEYQKKSEEMYQGLTRAIVLGWRAERCFRETRRFPGLDSIVVSKQCCDKEDKLEALVKLSLPELKWIESQMWRLRRIFLDQTDVLAPDGKTTFILIAVETILWKVLDAFSEKYLDRENEDKLSFLTSDEGIFELR